MQKMRKYEYRKKQYGSSRSAEILLQSLRFLRETRYSGRKTEKKRLFGNLQGSKSEKPEGVKFMSSCRDSDDLFHTFYNNINI